MKQSGHAILTIKPKNGDGEEKYLITLRTFEKNIQFQLLIRRQQNCVSRVSFGVRRMLSSPRRAPFKAVPASLRRSARSLVGQDEADTW